MYLLIQNLERKFKEIIDLFVIDKVHCNSIYYQIPSNNIFCKEILGKYICLFSLQPLCV